MKIQTKILSVFGISTILMIILAMFFINFATKSTENIQQFNDVELILLNDAWEIKWLDEVLTCSAARFIHSQGNSVWEARYNDHVGLLDDAFASAEGLATPEDFQIFDGVSDANDKLVEYEFQIFETAGKDDFDAANSILFGDYERQKGVYWNGMESFFRKQNQRIEDNLQTQIQQADLGKKTAITLIVVIALLNIIIGVVYARSITRPLNQLIDVSDKLTNGNFNVKVPEIKTKDEIQKIGEVYGFLIDAVKTLKKKK